MLAVFRERQLSHELHALVDLFEEAQICYLPLKGAVMRGRYPAPWMRTSCDLDILVHEEDLAAATRLLTEKLEYRVVERGVHDVVFESRLGVCVELHFDLVSGSRAKNAGPLLRTVWDGAVLEDGSGFRYCMDDAMFYLYHIAHMAKHFELGGCGVRPFLDLWLLNRAVDKNCRVARQLLLANAGLAAFADAAERLAEAWLSGTAMDETLVCMGDYILRAGVYGNQENRVASGQAQRGGRMAYLRSRLFVPYSRLRSHYPILQKHKWLFPFVQLWRWCKLPF